MEKADRKEARGVSELGQPASHPHTEAADMPRLALDGGFDGPEQQSIDIHSNTDPGMSTVP